MVSWSDQVTVLQFLPSPFCFEIELCLSNEPVAFWIGRNNGTTFEMCTTAGVIFGVWLGISTIYSVMKRSREGGKGLLVASISLILSSMISVCMSSSDHLLLTYNSNSCSSTMKKRFAFDRRWIGKDGFSDIVKKVWNTPQFGNPFFQLQSKITSCRIQLIKWSRDLLVSLAQKNESLEHSLDLLEIKVVIFSVKSPYFHLVIEKVKKLDIAESSGNAKLMQLVRKRSWGLKIKNKIKHFIWKCYSGILPSNNNVMKKGVKIDDICKSYGEAVETIEHILLSCPRAKTIWKFSPIHWDGLCEEAASFHLWWSKICSPEKDAISEDRIQLSTYLLWWLWKTRNMWLFEGIWKPGMATIDSSISEWQEFKGSSSRYAPQ
ncbi:hypothetical protein DH2020_040487 [Rehmannia glutinosa]|uniref:Reverse transcriptase zinc-binding domain-containing protein n=1 Tax=Rehmannia glutinosa TaxID=99300 RepID=A0ABR0UUV1_REHGL